MSQSSSRLLHAVPHICKQVFVEEVPASKGITVVTIRIRGHLKPELGAALRSLHTGVLCLSVKAEGSLRF